MSHRYDLVPSLAACVAASLLLAGCRCSGDGPPDAKISAPQTDVARPDSHAHTPGGIRIDAAFTEATRALFAAAPLEAAAAVAALRAEKQGSVPFATALLASPTIDEIVAGAMILTAFIEDGVAVELERESIVALFANSAPAVRAPAITLAGRLGHMDLILPLLAAPETTPSLRLTVVELAAENTGAVVDAALLDCIAKDSFPAVAEACALALTAPRRLPVAPTVVERLLGDLTTGLAAGSPSEALLLALAEAGVAIDEPHTNAIAAIANGENRPHRIRALAGRLLGTPEPAIASLTDTPPSLRLALGESSESTEMINHLLQDAVPGVRAAAVSAMARLIPATTRAARLAPFLDDPDPSVRKATIATIASVVPLDEAVAILSERLRTADDHEQASILAALRTIPDRLAIDALITALDDPRTQPAAWFALTTLSGENPIDAGPEFWRAWRDARFAVPEPPPSPADPTP